MKSRTRARELGLQFLYQVDLLGEAKMDDLTTFLREEEHDSEACRFARRLVEGSFQRRQEIDATIQGIAQNWKIPRMAVIDRNVLRLATFELLYCQDIPPKVAINEAIELGKRYSTANSGAFINGILDKVRRNATDPPETTDDPPTSVSAPEVDSSVSAPEVDSSVSSPEVDTSGSSPEVDGEQVPG